MKNIVTLIIFWFLLPFAGNGQVFEQLANSSGLIYSEIELETLETEAHKLASIFDDDDFLDEFKVFDYAFYTHNETMQVNVDALWNKAKIEAKAASKYYVLFGREFKDGVHKPKLRVDIVLPDHGIYNCINESSFSPISENISSSVRGILNFSDFKESFEIEKEAINIIRRILLIKIECCGGLNRDACQICEEYVIEDDDQLYFDNSIVYNKLIEKGFLGYPAKTVFDPEFFQPETPGPAIINGSSENRNSSSFTIDIQFQIDEAIIDLDEYVDAMIDGHTYEASERLNTDLSTKYFVYKFPRDCGSFDQIYSEFENDNSDIKYFFAYINSGNIGTFFYKQSGTDGQSLRRKIASKSERNSNIQQSRDEELDELKSLADQIDAAPYFDNVCGNKIFTSIGSGYESFANRLFEMLDENLFSKADRVFYDKERERIKDKNNKADKIYELYFNREFEIRYQEQVEWNSHGLYKNGIFGNSGTRIGVRISTHTALCREIIHATLEICGVVFPICDAANSVLYTVEGEYGKAALAAVAIIPFAEIGKGAKYINKVVRYGAQGSCSLSRGGKCKVISYVILGAKITEKHGDLKDEALKVMNEILEHTPNVFRGFNNYSGAIQWHHVLPYLTNARHGLLNKLMEAGLWSSKNINFNAIPLPTHLLDEAGVAIDRFHATHPRYTKWIKRKLDDIETKLNNKLNGLNPNSPAAKEALDKAFEEVIDLTEKAKDEIKKAFDAGEKLNLYFGNLL